MRCLLVVVVGTALCLSGLTGGAAPDAVKPDPDRTVPAPDNNSTKTNSTEKPYMPAAGDVEEEGTELDVDGDMKDKYGSTDSVGLTVGLDEKVSKVTTETPVKEEPLLTLDQLEAIPGAWSCDSPIYCRGPLLDAVQRSRVFPDSKTFVDMPLKYDPDATLEAYEDLVKKEGPLSKKQLKSFVDEHFLPAGEELEEWTPTDWVESPEMLESVSDPALKKWAGVLHGLWRTLGRRIKDSVPANSTRHSLLHVPNGFVIPGDRFREFYYWDTYWIVKGLLVSGMTNTTRGVIENMLHLVNELGFVPNGGRVYYKNRSQPPLLTLMVDAYYEATGDADFIKENLPLLEKEYDFWVSQRAVNVTKNGTEYSLARYSVNMAHPRAEGYLEDLEAMRGFSGDHAATQFAHLASGAESGWDYSTRWFTWSGEDEYTLRGIKTTNIVPVDLNTFLCLTENLLSKFAGVAGQSEKVASYSDLAQRRLSAMSAVLWHEEDGVWYDYDLTTNSSRRRFFLSNVSPLLLPAYADRATRVVDNLMSEGVLEYPGGVPTSRMASGQQWDFPNAWAPIVEILTTGLANADSNSSRELAYNISRTWVATNYAAWAQTGNMYEKYMVRRQGGVGKGGEYNVQKGFGWSNGVALQMLSHHGRALEAPDVEVMSGSGSGQGHSAQTKVGFVFIPVVLLIVAVLFFICVMMKKAKRRGKSPSAKYSSPPFTKFN